MREIKFRAWRFKKFMDYIDLNILTCNTIGLIQGGDRSELMQYTGLKDKNGKEIYEGDIVRLSFQKDNPAGVQDDRWYKRVATVEWAKDYAGFNPFCYQEHYQNEAGLLEVIGDIYENGELVKEE